MSSCCDRQTDSLHRSASSNNTQTNTSSFMHPNKLYVEMPYEEITLGASSNERRNGESRSRARGVPSMSAGEVDHKMDEVPLMMEHGFDYDDDDYLSEGYGSTVEGESVPRGRRKRKTKQGFCSDCWWFCCGGWKNCCQRFVIYCTFYPII